MIVYIPLTANSRGRGGDLCEFEAILSKQNSRATQRDLDSKKIKKSAHNTEGKDNQKDMTPKFRAMGAKIRGGFFGFFSPSSDSLVSKFLTITMFCLPCYKISITGNNFQHKLCIIF